MKIISSAQEIQNLLIKSIEKYKSIRFAVAWASENHDVSKILFKNISKIVSSTVGLHFSQTHPDFIKKFINDVKFIKNEHGIFHPKVYLFFNDENDWQCLIGSANFTKSALTENSEVMTFFSSDDNKSLFLSINEILDAYSNQAQFFDEKNLAEYRADWERKKNAKEKNDNYKFRGKSKSITNMKWDEYYQNLQKTPEFDDRIKLLNKAHEYFNDNDFEKMGDLKRKNISGVEKYGNNDLVQNWFLFGHMPIPRFIQRVSDFDSQLKFISDSLEKIPSTGEISRKDFMNFIYYFKAADKYFKEQNISFEKASWGYGIGPISRLLAMKRPDVFYCLTGPNGIRLYKDFEIKKINRKEYERYWDDIIEKIRNTEWYKSVPPTDEKELDVWKKRVAMMDAFFYNE